MTDLDPRLTFETFVVGPANRLASAAARRAAEAPGSSYNPLFVYGGPGLGKSHILSAVAHRAVQGAEDSPRVLYQTTEDYLAELAQALGSGGADDLRDRYGGLDLLVLDDVQFLAGQREAQEMLLRTVDGLTSAGGQIVLASDRPPSEIDALDERLLSRFSGGLMVDIAPPEFETRVAILRRMVTQAGQELGDGVAEALARRPFNNVRELSGGLNRVLALQELEERAVSLGELDELLAGLAEPDDGLDTFESFLPDISVSFVAPPEQAWRKALREAVEVAEADGVSAKRLRKLLEDHHEPDDWSDRLDRFHEELRRLREIEAELDRLGNPWPKAAVSVVRDPDRLAEAEALLGSVRERVRPYAELAEGPGFDELGEHFASLPLKAVQQMVSGERPQYMPLYLWSRPAEGARALLGAAGRAFRARDAEASIAVVSISEYAQDFIRALSDGVAGAWRERWWTVDLLLVHGVEELGETERAQEEFFHLFEALKRRGSGVLLVADRAPGQIEAIDDRLRSRFEGGLVLEAAARKLPDGAGELRRVEPADEPDESEAWLEATPSNGEQVAVESDPGAWDASPENVVWSWPYLVDRVVEELD